MSRGLIKSTSIDYWGVTTEIVRALVNQLSLGDLKWLQMIKCPHMGLVPKLWGKLELQFCRSTGLRSKTAPIHCKIYTCPIIIAEHRLNHVRGTLDPNTITGNP